MAHNNLAPSVNCSLDDIDLNALKVIMLFKLNIYYNYYKVSIPKLVYSKTEYRNLYSLNLGLLGYPSLWFMP